MASNEHARWYASLSDVGQDREINEDACAEYELDDSRVLLVVADGMGGHEHGEVASAIAVEAIGQIVQNSPAEDVGERLLSGFRVANQRILAEAERTDAEGMGTTAVAAFVDGNKVYVAHVGDSRLYHIRDGDVLWHTRDHTRVQRMVDMGILDPEDAKDHPDSNVVTRALGYQADSEGEPIEPDVSDEPLVLKEGDSLVLCSDGLYDGLDDWEIAESLDSRSAEEAAAELVDFANDRGCHDNITVTVLHYGTELGNPNKVVHHRPETEKPVKRTTVADESSAARAADDDGGDEDGDSDSDGDSDVDGDGDEAVASPVDEGRDEESKRRLGVLFIVAAIAIIVIAVVIFMVSGKKSDDSGSGGAQTPSGDAGTGAAKGPPADAIPRVDADYPEGYTPPPRGPGAAKTGTGDDDDDDDAPPSGPGVGLPGPGSNVPAPPPPAVDDLEKKP
jgi:protein phosphatase